MSRKSITKKTRFEVFKRDSFTCQYCGVAAPDAVLHIDHIKPVKTGGKNEIINLITSCLSCNLGKGAKELSDDSAVKKQKRQLDELNARREQLEMIAQWREGLKNIQNDTLELVVNHYSERLRLEVKEKHRIEFRRLLKKYGLEVLLESIDASADQYLVPEGEWYTQKSLQKTFDYITRICANKAMYKQKPYMEWIHRIAGRIRMKFGDTFSFKELCAYVESGFINYQLGYEVFDNALQVAKDWEHFSDLVVDGIECNEDDEDQDFCVACGEIKPFTLYKITAVYYEGTLIDQGYPKFMCGRCISKQEREDLQTKKFEEAVKEAMEREEEIICA